MNATDAPPLPAPPPTGASTPRVTDAPAARWLELARLTGTVSALTIGACGVIAAAVAVAAPVPVRDWLDFTFPGVAVRPSVAVGIFAHNLRTLTGVFVLLIFARLAPRVPHQQSARLAVRLGELILAGAITANIVLVGAALSAYQERMLLALLPHGPVELAAYALAIAIYLQDRRRHQPTVYVAKVALASVALLALAAVLETWVNV